MIMKDIESVEYGIRMIIYILLSIKQLIYSCLTFAHPLWIYGFVIYILNNCENDPHAYIKNLLLNKKPDILRTAHPFLPPFIILF